MNVNSWKNVSDKAIRVLVTYSSATSFLTSSNFPIVDVIHEVILEDFASNNSLLLVWNYINFLDAEPTISLRPKIFRYFCVLIKVQVSVFRPLISAVRKFNAKSKPQRREYHIKVNFPDALHQLSASSSNRHHERHPSIALLDHIDLCELLWTLPAHEAESVQRKTQEDAPDVRRAGLHVQHLRARRRLSRREGGEDHREEFGSAFVFRREHHRTVQFCVDLHQDQRRASGALLQDQGRVAGAQGNGGYRWGEEEHSER